MTREQIRDALADLQQGDAMFFPAPGSQPYNRDLYLRVNSIAYKLWGKGTYKMMAGPHEVGVHRKRSVAAP